MGDDISIIESWNQVRPLGSTLDHERLLGLPPGARRYLQHAITRGERLATAVRLRMHGRIRLKAWYPFEAEEFIDWGRGFLWRATVKMKGVRISGFDSLQNGIGTVRWKLFGVLPLVMASGTDITRSAAGRVNVESIWLPSVLTDRNVRWIENDALCPEATFSAHGEQAELAYTIAENGRLLSVNMPRWGNPGNSPFAYYSCGGFAEEEGTFAGYTIPTRMRIGWHFGTTRFDREGEFFRVTIDDAQYR